MTARKPESLQESAPDFTFHPFEIACCGYSNSGKTTLISRIVSLLSERYAIGYYKHGCHRFDIDREGKDSFVVRQSGAAAVMVSDPEKKALTNVVALVAPDPATVPETFGVPVFQRDDINEIADCIINRFLDKASRQPTESTDFRLSLTAIRT